MSATAPQVRRRLARLFRTLTAAFGRPAAGVPAQASVPASEGREPGGHEPGPIAVTFDTAAGPIDDERRALISDVAHELRTPLTNVRFHLEAALDGVVPLDPALIRLLIDESAVLERLVADLEDLGHPGASMAPIHPEERDAAELAAQAVAAHSAQAEASGVDLSLTVIEPVTVCADATRLRQALGNLVSNALRHTPAGGSVAVTVRRSGNAAVFTVSDTGPGIAAEHVPRIFERFYRAAPSGGRAPTGSGLGLAITKRLVEAHHGRLDVASTPGEGATFTIRIPRAGADACFDCRPPKAKMIALGG
ncbi:sensor histidine kinase [Actinomadura viridis]|uniref:sensor histidine kinase n=1 Tax=Actinomadura viridis TaxID=58110 RepID=UPI00368C94C7